MQYNHAKLREKHEYAKKNKTLKKKKPYSSGQALKIEQFNMPTQEAQYQALFTSTKTKSQQKARKNEKNITKCLLYHN